MSRVDRVSRIVAAAPGVVYQALVEAERLEVWLPPQGMSGRLERFDARPGGGFRMVLTYLDPAGSPGKTSQDQDVVDVEFVDLVPDRCVVQRAVFASDNPDYAGTMLMTWQLAAVPGGSEVVVTATDVPSGIDRAAHEAGMASSLANLAAYVLEPALRG